MSNAVTAQPEADRREIIEVLQNSLYPGAKQESIELVLAYCRVHQIDPLLKPVHIVPTSVKVWKDGKDKWEFRDVLMPGIADYRIKAARTGEYAGKSEPEFGPDVVTQLDGERFTHPTWCRVTVRRMVGGRPCDFPAKEYWLENYATAGKDSDAPNKMWRKRKYGQLAKCAEAQALRMAFPEFSGGSYTAEEMEGKTGFDGVTIEADGRHVPARHAAPSIGSDRGGQPVDLRSRAPVEEQVARGQDIITNGSGPTRSQQSHTVPVDNAPDDHPVTDDAPDVSALEKGAGTWIEEFSKVKGEPRLTVLEEGVIRLLDALSEAGLHKLRGDVAKAMTDARRRILPPTDPAAPLEASLPPVAAEVGK